MSSNRGVVYLGPNKVEVHPIGDPKMETPAGKFENVVETKETSAIEKGSETKHHARGIGVVQDGGCKLVKYGKAKK